MATSRKSEPPQSTFWSAEHLAKISASPGSEREWLERVVTSRLNSLRLLSESAPAGWSTRTFPASCQLTADGGFGVVLGALAQLGYGFAYRILDAQYFGLPQRRERLFVVGYLGDWRPAAAVLFERASLSGDPAPSRAPWEAATADAISGAVSSKWVKGAGGPAGDEAYNLIAKPLGSRTGGFRQDLDNDTYVVPILEAGARTGREGFEARDGLGVGEPGDPCSRCRLGTSTRSRSSPRTTRGKDGAPSELKDIAGALNNGGGKPGQGYPAMMQGAAVRRLTPRECERLQGFPDDYTLIPYRGKPASDSARYRSLGNSFPVPVVRWIGERIQMVEDILCKS